MLEGEKYFLKVEKEDVHHDEKAFLIAWEFI